MLCVSTLVTVCITYCGTIRFINQGGNGPAQNLGRRVREERAKCQDASTPSSLDHEESFPVGACTTSNTDPDPPLQPAQRRTHRPSWREYLDSVSLARCLTEPNSALARLHRQSDRSLASTDPTTRASDATGQTSRTNAAVSVGSPGGPEPLQARAASPTISTLPVVAQPVLSGLGVKSRASEDHHGSWQRLPRFTSRCIKLTMRASATARTRRCTNIWSLRRMFVQNHPCCQNARPTDW
jgi:hypothetical protein